MMLGILLSLEACAPAVRNAPVAVDDYGRPVRLACVGDSLTANEGCWPEHLRRMLGERWDVLAFGLGGSTILSFGDFPYIKLKLPDVLACQPDVVVILLGTNDSKPRHWYYRKEVERDYHHLLAQLEGMASRPRIWICLPPPAFPGQWGIDEGRLSEMRPVIRRVARKHGIPVIDLYEPLVDRADWFPDQIHPDPRASREIARRIYMALTGNTPALPDGPETDPAEAP